ncbi:hypothetical protein ALC53_09408 [Atta colombica]|uniref:Uncharacterized protein n=1 Tax=Atta colombica TaxID=520822 RepID=A0A195B7Z2_9HYME|nr:hypothetical protein ALC53_09408 [Atta colombica]
MVAALRCCLYLVAIKSAILNHISNRFSIGHFSHSRCAFTATSIAFFTSCGVAQSRRMFGSPFSLRTQCAELPKLRQNTRPVDANTVPSDDEFPTSHENTQGRNQPKWRLPSLSSLRVRLPNIELLIIPTDSHVHRCKQSYLNAKCVDVHTASFLSLNCILGSGVLVRLSLAEPIAELLSSSGFVGGVGILIAARVAAIACSIADFPPDSGVLVCDIVGTFGALCSLQSVFFSVVEVDIVVLASLLIGEGGGIPDAVICGDAAII